MEKELKKGGSQPEEKSSRSFGETLGSFGLHAKDAAAKAQSAIAKAVDRNGDGKIDAEDFGLTRENLEAAGDAVKGAAIAAGHGLKAGGSAMGKALSDARLQAERKALRPVFPEELPFGMEQDKSTNQDLPSILSVAVRDKKRAESEVCQGSVGYYQTAKGYDHLCLYEDNLTPLPLTFYPTASQGIFLASPYQNGVYIAVDEYFNFIRKGIVNELELVAQSLGAKHVRISFQEDTKAHTMQKMHSHAKAQKAKAAYDHESTLHESSNVEIAADVKFSGHTFPVAPDLVYFRNESDILKLIQMRTSNSSNRIESKTYRFQCNQLFGVKEKREGEISAVLNYMKPSGAVSYNQNIQRESRTILEYSIEF